MESILKKSFCQWLQWITKLVNQEAFYLKVFSRDIKVTNIYLYVSLYLIESTVCGIYTSDLKKTKTMIAKVIGRFWSSKAIMETHKSEH